MPYPNEHSARLREPGSFDPNTFRRTQGSGKGRVQGAIVPKTIDVIWGKLKSAAKASDPPLAQALRFPIKRWTASQARAWLRANKIKYIRFEPAAPKKQEAEGATMDMEKQWMISDIHFAAVGNVDASDGVLYDVAICTEGEAKGHGVHLDRDFIERVIEYGNAKGGVKARYGHPTMSSTALGTFLGRFKNFRSEDRDGKLVAKADLFLSVAAKESPSGDLFGYVLNLAVDDPKAFGSSIVFQPGRKFIRDDEGNKVYTSMSSGQEETVFVELKELKAADLVDDPAANPDGLFGQFASATWAGQVSEFLDTHPDIFDLLEKNPEVYKGFLERYREYKQRRTKGQDMADETNDELLQLAAEAAPDDVTAPPAAEAGEEEGAEEAAEAEGKPEEEVTPEVQPEAETDIVEPPKAEGEAPAEEQAEKTEGQKFLDAFGDIGGVWFAKGLTFEEAKEKQAEQLKADNESLKAEVADLQNKVAALTSPGEEPVSFDDVPADLPEMDFEQKAQALAKEKDISLTKAMSELAKEEPDLFRAYKTRKQRKR